MVHGIALHDLLEYFCRTTNNSRQPRQPTTSIFLLTSSYWTQSIASFFLIFMSCHGCGSSNVQVSAERCTKTMTTNNSHGNEEKPPLLLPSTINDIIPSVDARLRPLSSEELHDIRSLIGVAKGGGGGSSRDGAAEAAPLPLAGRRAMIPVTSKAFFEGILEPAPNRTLDSTKAAAIMNEQIIINDGNGNLVEMTRAEADDYFDKAAIPSNKKSIIRANKSSLKTSNMDAAASYAAANETPSAGDVVPSTLPFMEIRETCDVSGNILNSEVVNMSNTIQRLGDGLKGVTDNVVGDEDGEESGKLLGELLAKTLKEGESDITKNVHASYHNEEGVQEETSSSSDDEHPKSKSKVEPISDAAYEALSSRLEELERMEEEDSKSKMENVKSSKRLQSSGWSKGFLNANSSSSATKKKSASSASESAAPRGRKATSAKREEERRVRVSFSGDDSEIIKVMPNIGSDGGEKKSRVSFSASDNEIEDVKSNLLQNEDTQHQRPTLSKQGSSKVSFSTSDGEIEVPPNNRFHALEKQVSFSKVSFSSDDDQIPQDGIATKSDGESEEKVARVSFSTSDNKVKEIPRIGQSKVPPRPSPGRPVSFEEVREIDPFSPISTVPFEENVFRGVVKERNNVGGMMREEEGGREAKEEALPKKKLSRFAQQRLQME